MSVDATELRRVVERLAADQPDFVYKLEPGEKSCLYTHKGVDKVEVPGCIIGTGLFVLKQPIPYDDVNNRATGVASLVHQGIITGNHEDVDWLFSVQSEQDMHAPWGEAVAEANRCEIKGNDDEF